MELEFKEKRELYKAMRSAHDGICPMCGGRCAGNTPEIQYQCLSCGFELTREETEIIKGWRDLFHNDLAIVLEKWRS